MIINIYDKETLKNIARPIVPSIVEFEKTPTVFFPNWNAKTMIFSQMNFKYPKFENGKLVEKTRVELYNNGLIQLNSNEIFENGEIKEIQLHEFEYIENNKIKYNRVNKIEMVKEELSRLKVEFSEKEFIFKEIYKQKNRDLDKNNLTSIVVMMTATKQTYFKDWKFKDLEDNDVYVDLTLQDMMLLANIMQEQTTKAMKTETEAFIEIGQMTDEELKTVNIRAKYEELWNK